MKEDGSHSFSSVEHCLPCSFYFHRPKDRLRWFLIERIMYALLYRAIEAEREWIQSENVDRCRRYFQIPSCNNKVRVLVTNCWLERMWIEYWAKINIISTYSPHIINILSISTFHQQEIPQLIFKLPITQQVNGKEPTTNSTFIELTHSLPCTYHLIPILEWILCW